MKTVEQVKCPVCRNRFLWSHICKDGAVYMRVTPIHKNKVTRLFRGR